MGKKIAIITKQYDHHIKVSGFSRIADYIEDADVISNVTSRVPYTIKKRISKLFRPPYLSSALDAELVMLSRIHKEGYEKVFYTYIESMYRIGWVSRYFSRLKLIGALHYPANVLSGVVNYRSLESFCFVGCMSSDQKENLLRSSRVGRVEFIPHGVDTKYFFRDTKVRDIDILFVGEHMRDVDYFMIICAQLIKMFPEVIIVAITNRRAQRYSWSECGIMHLSGIDDDQLRDCYSRAKLLVLPLISATANNTILEAMASGVVVLATDLIATRDYLPKHYKFFLTHNLEQDKRLISGLLSGVYDISEISYDLREHVEQYSWSNVGKVWNEWIRRM